MEDMTLLKPMKALPASHIHVHNGTLCPTGGVYNCVQVCCLRKILSSLKAKSREVRSSTCKVLGVAAKKLGA